MSVLQYPNPIDVQIWNNAAFDNIDTDDSIPISSPNHLDSFSTKENLCPSLCTPSVCINSQTPIKPLCQGKPLKVLFKQGLLSPTHHFEVQTSNNTHEALLGDRNIDAEIEAMEREISRLSLKLESLRLEKEEKSVESMVRTGSFKVSEQKQTSKGVSFLSRKIEATPEVSNGVKTKRKGLSMGPWEIAAGIPLQKGKQERTPIQSGKAPRGISLGPSEIAAGIRLHKGIQPEKTLRTMSIGPSEILGGPRFQKRGKQELTPILSSQKSRRKSCFFNLQNVDEEKVTKGTRGRTLSLSPKSRQSNALIQSSKQRFATIGSNKICKKDDHILSNIQPKNLFKEEDMSAASKRPYKGGRVVASRYTQCSASQRQNDPRKMSLPGNDRSENLKRPSAAEIKRVCLPESGSNQGTESKLEVSSRAVSLTHNSSPPTLKIGELLPKLRIIPSRFESPRDSGPAKKVVDLVGKKFFFAEEESSMEDSVCQTLRFDEEEEE